jgi:hypothetical protein
VKRQHSIIHNLCCILLDRSMWVGASGAERMHKQHPPTCILQLTFTTIIPVVSAVHFDLVIESSHVRVLGTVAMSNINTNIILS